MFVGFYSCQADVRVRLQARLQTRLLRGAARARIVGVMDGKSYTQHKGRGRMHARSPSWLRIPQ